MIKIKPIAALLIFCFCVASVPAVIVWAVDIFSLLFILLFILSITRFWLFEREQSKFGDHWDI